MCIADLGQLASYIARKRLADILSLPISKGEAAVHNLSSMVKLSRSEAFLVDCLSTPTHSYMKLSPNLRRLRPPSSCVLVYLEERSRINQLPTLFLIKAKDPAFIAIFVFSLKSHMVPLLTPLHFIYQLSIPVVSPVSSNGGDA